MRKQFLKLAVLFLLTLGSVSMEATNSINHYDIGVIGIILKNAPNPQFMIPDRFMEDGELIDPVQISIYDDTGKTVFSIETKNQNINVPTFKGHYVILLSIGDNYADSQSVKW